MKTLKIILASTYTVGFLGWFVWFVVNRDGWIMLLAMVGIVCLVMLLLVCIVYLIDLFLDP